MRNQVQLICYVDRLSGGGLAALNELLSGELGGLFGTVHLLPFFHPIDGSDAGFDPIDHTLVDPRLGTWDDVSALSRTMEVMADLIVNHISVRSPQFLDFSRHGEASPWAGLFLTFDRVFPGGATECDLLRIYRPRPSLPFSVVTQQCGKKRALWTTFTAEQVDIDLEKPLGRAYLSQILQTFGEAGIRMVRLDAVGYSIKRPGSSCFMIPETYEFISELSAEARRLGIEVLVEIHSHYREQIEIAKRVDWVYDFALPALVLHALYQADAVPLRRWLEVSPRNAMTVLDTHDGIGVLDVSADASRSEDGAGLLAPEAIDALVEKLHERSAGQSRLATGAAAQNLDIYQVNCTYYDALGRDDRDYLLARAIQFFAPGIPQVYYVGLLFGLNDIDLLQRTGVGRDINRRYYTRAEVRQALAHPTVQRLLELIRFRNRHPAFAGQFSMPASPAHQLVLEWRAGEAFARLEVDLRTRQAAIRCSDEGAMEWAL